MHRFYTRKMFKCLVRESDRTKIKTAVNVLIYSCFLMLIPIFVELAGESPCP